MEQQVKKQLDQKAHPPQNEEHKAFTQQLEILFTQVTDYDKKVQASNDAFQHLAIGIQTRDRYVAAVQHFERHPAAVQNLEQARKQLAQCEVTVRDRANVVRRLRENFMDHLAHRLDEHEAYRRQLFDVYLKRWYEEQQLMNNGVAVSTLHLDTIQAWMEKIVLINWRIKNQIKVFQLHLSEPKNVRFDIEALNRMIDRADQAMDECLQNCFVVEKQPPQVMKTNTRFQASVRALCGKQLNIQFVTPPVKALILSESNARAVLSYHKQLFNNKASNSTFPTVEDQNHAYTYAYQQHPPQQHQQVVVAPSPGGAIVPDYQPVTPVTPMTSAIPYNQQQQQQHVTQQQLLVDQTNLPNGHQVQATSMDTDQDQSISFNDHHTPSPQSYSMPPHQQHHHHHHQQQTQPQQHYVPQEQQEYYPVQRMQPCRIIERVIGYNPAIQMNSKDFDSSGEILNNSTMLELADDTGLLTGHFRNMQLKKIKRTEKKGTESVMDEKFVLLFFTEFTIADDTYFYHELHTPNSHMIKRQQVRFHVIAASLPVVVIVHGNQEPHAWATVTWHNAFARPDDILYKVPDKVPWRELGYVLSEKFKSCAGRGLTEQNLRYLASKVCRCRVDNDDVLVSWNQFSKEPLADRTFTFWEWFHSILKLTKDYLRDLWKAELIFGFVGKEGCVDFLLGTHSNEPCPMGTFLLRFSETEHGGITIAWVGSASAMSPSLNDQVQISRRVTPTHSADVVVNHLQPFVGKDLNTRSLADRIRDLNDLIYLYPNVPKDLAFEPYYTPISKTHHLTSTGYIQSMLVTTLPAHYPGSIGSPMTHDSANLTPASMCQSSPDNYYQDNIQMTDMLDASYPQFNPAHLLAWSYGLQHHMAQNSAINQRPLYMTIFLESLRKHNDAQPKYQPTPKDQASQSEKPSMSFSQTSVNSVSNTAPTNGQSSGAAQSYRHSQEASQSLGRSQSSNRSGAYGAVASIQYNSPLPTAPNSLKPQTKRQLSVKTTTGATGTAAGHTSPSRRPTHGRQAKVSSTSPKTPGKIAQKGSSTPSVSHAPAATLGSGSTSTKNNQTQSKNQAGGGPFHQDSMTKTIAEQTPNAFQTLGPGFDVAKEEATGRNSSNAMDSQLSSLPSDFEHIYHAPSQLNLDGPPRSQKNSGS